MFKNYRVSTSGAYSGEVRAYQFDGIEQNAPDCVKICGIKLPVYERKGEFYDPQTELYYELRVNDWLIILPTLQRIVLTDDSFKYLFTLKE